MKQVVYWGPTNISSYRSEFNRPATYSWDLCTPELKSLSVAVIYRGGTMEKSCSESIARYVICQMFFNFNRRYLSFNWVNAVLVLYFVAFIWSVAYAVPPRTSCISIASRSGIPQYSDQATGWTTEESWLDSRQVKRLFSSAKYLYRSACPSSFLFSSKSGNFSPE